MVVKRVSWRLEGHAHISTENINPSCCAVLPTNHTMLCSTPNGVVPFSSVVGMPAQYTALWECHAYCCVPEPQHPCQPLQRHFLCLSSSELQHHDVQSVPLNSREQSNPGSQITS